MPESKIVEELKRKLKRKAYPNTASARQKLFGQPVQVEEGTGRKFYEIPSEAKDHLDRTMPRQFEVSEEYIKEDPKEEFEEKVEILPGGSVRPKTKSKKKGK